MKKDEYRESIRLMVYTYLRLEGKTVTGEEFERMVDEAIANTSRAQLEQELQQRFGPINGVEQMSDDDIRGAWRH